MTYNYRIESDTSQSQQAPPPTHPDRVRPARRASGAVIALRVLLWLVALPAAAANAAGQLADLDESLRLACGIVAVVAIVGIVLTHVLGRRK